MAVRQLAAATIHRAEKIPIYAFAPDFIENAASCLERRAEITLSVTERVLYLHIAGRDFTTTVTQHHIA